MRSGAETETETEGFVAPELRGGAAPSPASDVYAMAALGWFCLTGALPAPVAERELLTRLRPEIPERLVGVLNAALGTDPASRPTAGEAAVEVFDAAPAESVALVSRSDPAAEITRRIRAAAASAPEPASPGRIRRHQRQLAFAGVVLLAVVALGGGATWFLRRPPVDSQRVAVGSAARSPLPPTATATATSARAATSSGPRTSLATPAAKATPTAAPARRTAPTKVAPSVVPPGATEVVMAPSSPRRAPAELLQRLVDPRALAYVTRDPALLDLVYLPGAAPAEADRRNIATALQNGGTYLGLSFVVKDVAFVDGTSGTARIRATILTPAYRTGQPDGRKIAHAKEILGPCIFSLGLTPDGWRVLALTVS